MLEVVAVILFRRPSGFFDRFVVPVVRPPEVERYTSVMSDQICGVTVSTASDSDLPFAEVSGYDLHTGKLVKNAA